MRVRTALFAAGLLGAAGASAGQMDISTFNNLRRGMHEAEVLARAGEPDRITSPGGHHPLYVRRGPRVELHYVPQAGEHDPWVTVVVLTRGRVSALERHRLPYRGVAAASATVGTAVSPRRDEDILRERAERTLRAARRYAEVRWRILEREAARGGASDTMEPRPVYRGTDDAGTPYYGDVAPSAARPASPG